MPAWLFSLPSRDTLGWPSLPTLGALPPLPAPTAVAPLLPRPGAPAAGPRPALPVGAEVSVDLLRAMPTRIVGGPAAPHHSQGSWRARAAGRGPQAVVTANPRASAACW